MTLLGYARVSTTHQSVDMQVRALKNAGAEHIWTEQMSGGRDDRPALAELLAAAATGDVLMVWRLDRLGRSLPHLLTVAADLDFADPFHFSRTFKRVFGVSPARFIGLGRDAPPSRPSGIP